MIAALLLIGRASAQVYTVDPTTIADLPVPLLVKPQNVFPFVQVAMRDFGTTFVIWESITQNTTRTFLTGRKKESGVWSSPVGLDDEDLDPASLGAQHPS